MKKKNACLPHHMHKLHFIAQETLLKRCKTLWILNVLVLHLEGEFYAMKLHKINAALRFSVEFSCTLILTLQNSGKCWGYIKESNNEKRIKIF